MGNTSDLQAFIVSTFGKKVWIEICDTIESSAVMFAQKLVGESYVDDVVMKKLIEALNPLTDEQALKLNRLLSIDNDIKGMVFDALQRMKKERGLE